MLIVDEAQTIEGERGYLIELLVMKLRLLNPSIQIIFLSATLPEPTRLASWLNASMYLYENRLSQWKPSKRNNITEYSVCDGKVTSPEGHVIHDFNCVDRGSSLLRLIPWIYQTFGVHTTSLVFCPTKARCEDVVRSLISIVVGRIFDIECIASTIGQTIVGNRIKHSEL